MYEFRDITNHSAISNPLPAEAVSINGQYIENVLDGYRTLYTKGRESLGAELTTYSVGVSNGERFKFKRYPARMITVGFQLIGKSPSDFREKFTNLNNLLSMTQADFIFNDETDKFFTGYPIMDAEPEAGELSVKGEWHIKCLFPFKRSVEPVVVDNPQISGNTATFNIDYKGVIPSYPLLSAEFTAPKTGGSFSEDGDCGFVAFLDAKGNIIQLGNPNALDLDATAISTLINKGFINITDWNSGGTAYDGRATTGTMTTGSISDPHWNRDEGQTQSYARANSYGSGTGWHGSGLYKTVTASPSWNLNIVHRMAVQNPTQTGCFECSVRDANGNIATGFVIDKDSAGVTGTVKYIINNEVVDTDTINLDYYNEHFGYCNKTDVYVTQEYIDEETSETLERVVTVENGEEIESWETRSVTNYVTKTREVFSGYNYTQSNLNSSIVKAYNQTIIRVGNLPAKTFNTEILNDVSATRVSFYFGTKGTALHTNAVASCCFRKTSGEFEKQPNVFTAGDAVQADCNDASIALFRNGSMGGYLVPNMGALGNHWESFSLKAGSNVIRAVWSPWVNANYHPIVRIIYNEVYI